MSTQRNQRNEGEGNKTAARQYNRAAHEFTETADVDAAARAAAESVDENGIGLGVDEQDGKQPARGEDALLHEPAWWSDDLDSAWQRVKSALRRDWEQTKHDLSASGGVDLNQGIGNTIRQARGTEPIPRGRVPEWRDVEPAVRFGFAAAMRYRDDDEPPTRPARPEA